VGVRTTVEFEADVSRAIDELRRREGRGVSDAVNTLIRRGMAAGDPAPLFEPILRDLGLRIDVSNVSDALDLLEGADER
jgi:predicted nucleotide-binding protein (sugar kinase/HSP70/actin superfamily)